MEPIKFPARFRQPVSFEGMEYGRIYPSDIDGIIDLSRFGGWVVFELKRGDAKVPAGQRLLLENIVKDAEKAGNKAIAIIGRHEVANPEKAVILADAVVREYYCGSAWHKLRGRAITCKELTDGFIKGELKHEV